MRTISVPAVWIGGGLVILLGLAPPALRAEPKTYPASVVVPDVEMRAGPSMQFPGAGKLRKGEQVFVHHEENDGRWLAVVPPPGSVSWVNHRFLGEFDPNGTGRQNAIIMADRVEVRVGGDRAVGPLPVKQVELPRGTIVEVCGPKAHAENSYWYPITPAEGEFRFIPREAVTYSASPSVPSSPPGTTISASPGSPTALPGHPGGGPGVPARLTSGGGPARVGRPDHPLWVRAEQAERAGDYAEAERLYTQLADDLKRTNGDHDLALLCFNRINRVRERRNGTPPGVAARPDSGNPANPGPPPSAQLQPPGGGVAARPQEVGTSATAVAQLQSSGPGWLRRAGFYIDGRQAYALENDQGGPRLYVTAQNGLSLDPYLNRYVELFGAIQTRGDIRGANYMTAARANVLR